MFLRTILAQTHQSRSNHLDEENFPIIEEVEELRLNPLNQVKSFGLFLSRGFQLAVVMS